MSPPPLLLPPWLASFLMWMTGSYLWRELSITWPSPVDLFVNLTLAKLMASLDQWLP